MSHLIDRIVDELKFIKHVNVFDDIDSENLWIDYCIAAQEGFLSSTGGGCVKTRASVQIAFEKRIQSLVDDSLNSLADHSLRLLEAIYQDLSPFERQADEGILSFSLRQEVGNRLKQRALEEKVELRSAFFDDDGTENALEYDGFVWKVLSERGKVSSILELMHHEIYLSGDVEAISEALLTAFVEEIKNGDEDTLLALLFDEHGEAFEEFLLQTDIIPTAMKMIE